ncbi:hypothetical protein Tco_1288012 [Tanacetum coccineum]
MKLNPKKCSFGVEECLFLGHLITKQGIKANPLKVKAVIDLDQPRTLKDIQSLNRKLATLSRFYQKVRKDPWLSSKYSKSARIKDHTVDNRSSNEKETPVDFLVEIPFEDNEKKEKPKEVPNSNSKWRLYTDGASNSDGSGLGLMLTSMTFEHLTKEVLVKVLTKTSIKEKEVLKVDMQERKSWMDPIYEYLLSVLLLEDTKEARKIRI